MNTALGSDSRPRNGTKVPFIAKLFALFAGYTVLPFIEIPVLGLSLSALLFFLMFMEVFFKSKRRQKLGVSGWGWLSVAACTCFALSAISNGLFSGGENFGKPEIVKLFYYFYWAMVFFTTAYLLALRPGIFSLSCGVFAIAVTILALARLYEAVRYGSIGAWTRLYFMTQNEYAWLFSSYAIFLAGFLFEGRNSKRIMALCGLTIVMAALLVNGSRSSWIAMAVSILSFAWIYTVATPQKARAVVKTGLFLGVIAVLLGGFIKFAPMEVRERFLSRFSTFENLEQDKSYQIRRLMVQKAKILMKNYPIWGCGPGRFRVTQVELDLPKVLRYGSNEYFNAKSSHNSYMQFFAEMGFLGGAPYILLIIVLVWKGFGAAVFLTRQKQYWAAALYASFISMSVHLWSLSGLTGTAPWLKYGMVAGLITVVQNVRRQRRMEAARSVRQTERAPSI